MDAQLKPDIYDASIDLNTIGQELRSIAEIHNKDIADIELLLNIELTNKCVKLKPAQIKKVRDYFDIAGLDTYIQNFQNNYKETLDRCKTEYKQSKHLFREFKGMISILGSKFNSNNDRLNDVLDFFDMDSIEEILALKKTNHALFKTKKINDINQINLTALLRKGIIVAETNNTPDYNENGLKQWVEERDWFKHLADTNYLKHLPDIYREFGITLVLVPHLQNTVYGLVHWHEEKPIVVITDKGKDLASCWGTLFHEIGHLINDKGCSIFEYKECSSLKKKELAEIEKNANDFANQYLLNNNDLRRIVFAAKNKGENMTWTDVCRRYGIHKIFAQYWLRKASIEPWKNKAISIDFNDII